MEELNTRLIRPYESRLRCLFIAFLVACFVMSVTYLFGGFSNHLPTPIWLRVLYFPVVIFLILFFSGRFVVPVGYVAILYRLGTPQYNRIHTEGLHWSFYPFEALHLHPNQKFINTDEYRLEDVACYNKAFMTINAKVQWRLVDPFKQIGQDPIQLGHAYHNCIFDTISNYINDHKTTNAEIFNIKYTIEKVVLSELSLLVKPWGEVIDGVSLRLSPADTEWITIWKSQSEVDYIIERATKMAVLEGINAEEALRQIAIKEGWIKATESIHKIRDIDKIISQILTKL